MPVARAFINNGYRVFGCDVDPKLSNQLREFGGEPAKTPAALCETADTILILVLNDQQVKQVITGDQGILSSNIHDLTLVCMSTINRSVLEEMAAECIGRGLRFVDCPFTGGPARVHEGNLTLIAAGEPATIESVKPVLACIGNINVIGETPGLGQAVKHCNQLLVGTTHAATMEVIALSRRLGLDTKQVCKVIGDGIAGSDYFRLLSEAVLNQTPSPGSLGQMCKDVSIVKNTASEAGLAALVANAAAAYFKQAENKGMQQCEGADLIEVVEGG